MTTFENFRNLSKSDWLAKVKKDLKGRAYEDLIWNVNERIRIEPYYTIDESNASTEPIQLPDEPLSWHQGLTVDMSTGAHEAGHTIGVGLEFGAQVVRLVNFDGNETTLQEVLEGVFPEMIGIQLLGSFNSEEQVAKIKKLNTSPEFSSGVFAEGDASWSSDVPEFIRTAERTLPIASGSVDEDMADLFVELLRLSGQDAGRLEKLLNTIQIHIHIGPQYFLEIARLRALKMCLLNLYKALQIKPVSVSIAGSLALPEKDDPLEQLIGVTTATLSAIQGGVHTLFFDPSQLKSKAGFSTRMLMNVQNLLKMESTMDWVIDPLAGSYFIEEATGQIATSVWNIFSDKI